MQCLGSVVQQIPPRERCNIGFDGVELTIPFQVFKVCAYVR